MGQNDEIRYEVLDVLYLIKDFLPKKPLVVTSGEIGVHWSNAVSYLDESGSYIFDISQTNFSNYKTRIDYVSDDDLSMIFVRSF